MGEREPRLADLLTGEDLARVSAAERDEKATHKARLAAGDLLDADLAARDEVAQVLGAVEIYRAAPDGSDWVEEIPPSRPGPWLRGALFELGSPDEVQAALDGLERARVLLARLSGSRAAILLPGPVHDLPAVYVQGAALLERLAVLFAGARVVVEAEEADLAERGQRWTPEGVEIAAGRSGGRPRRLLRDDVRKLRDRWPAEIYSNSAVIRGRLRMALEQYHPTLTDELLDGALREVLRKPVEKPVAAG